MKLAEQLVKLIAAVAAIAAVAYLVVKYFDKIKAWVQSICPCCAEEDDFAEDDEFAEPVIQETAPVEETPVEAPAEAPAEEAIQVAADDDAPVAEEDDFQE